MIVKIKDSGETLKVNDAWGTRLVEQGRAEALPPPPAPKPKKEKPAKKDVKADEPEDEDRA